MVLVQTRDTCQEQQIDFSRTCLGGRKADGQEKSDDHEQRLKRRRQRNLMLLAEIYGKGVQHGEV
jgi:hypothetical protein